MSPRKTIGDILDHALGGPKHFTSIRCREGHHRACLGFYAGRTCECECHDPFERPAWWDKPAKPPAIDKEDAA